jgi:hypothetical protein
MGLAIAEPEHLNYGVFPDAGVGRPDAHSTH